MSLINIKKLLFLLMILSSLIFVVACKDAKENINKDKEENIEVKWKDKNFKNEGSDLNYPDIYNHPDETIQDEINKKIAKIINGQMVDDENKESNEITSCNYKVTYNKNSVLSILFTCDHYLKGAASNIVYYQTLNINLKNGKILKLKDFFKEDYDYRKIINKYINMYLFSDKKWENETTETFDINDDENYYLTKNGFAFYVPEYQYDNKFLIDVSVMKFSEFEDNLKLVDYESNSENEDKGKYDTDANNEVIEYLKKGNFKSTSFGIGDNINDVVLNLGEPEEKSSYQGSEYYSYSNEDFFELYYVANDGENIGDTVISISIAGEAELYSGLEVGMDIEKFDDLIGDFKINQGLDEGYGIYFSQYEINNYMHLLLILDDNQKKVTGAELMIKSN